MVYFIQAADGGPVKIGKTDDLKRRFGTLQTSSPSRLRVLGATATVEESAMHEAFAEHRISGEWFRPADEILRFAAQFPVAGFRRQECGRKAIDADTLSTKAVAMMTARDSGETFASIAARYGMTRQGVHQHVEHARRVLSDADDSRKPTSGSHE